MISSHNRTALNFLQAAVLEYLAEVLQPAGNAACDNKKTCIVTRHIQLAVRNNEELSKLLGGDAIAAGGVPPNTDSVLLPKKAEEYSLPLLAPQTNVVSTPAAGHSPLV